MTETPELLPTDAQLENLTSGIGSILSAKQAFLLGWKSALGALTRVPPSTVGVERAHKVMTVEEYRAPPWLKGWHSICYNYDGFGGVGVRYDGASPTIASETEGGKAETWQDISTAPKDGTRLLLCYSSPQMASGALPVLSGHWSLISDCWFSPITDARINPTHWQPLPAPPASSLIAKGEGK